MTRDRFLYGCLALAFMACGDDSGGTADVDDDTGAVADTVEADGDGGSDAPATLTWAVGNPSTNENLNALVWGDSGFAAVGDNGVIRTSEDGGTWLTVHSPTGYALRGVLWDGVQYVAVGDGGTVLTSALGDQWLAQDTGTAGAGVSLAAITYADGTYVAVGAGGTILSSTTQAVGWQARTSGTLEALRAVAAGGGRFVAVGLAGTVLASSDGVVWDAADPGVTYDLAAVVRWNGAFVAGGNIGIYSSPDGAAPWTARTVDGATGVVVTGFGAGPYRVLAVTHGGDVLSSTDGLAWTFEGDRVTGSFLNAIAYGGGHWVLVGQAGTLFSTN